MDIESVFLKAMSKEEECMADKKQEPFAWAADIPGKFGGAPTVLFGYTEKLVKGIAATGGDVVEPFPLYRLPTGIMPPTRAKLESQIAWLEGEVKRLKESVNFWMDRSNAHAMEADQLREDRTNLRAKVWELTKETK